MARDKLLAAVAARLDRITKTQDASLALGPDVQRDARRLARSLRHDDGHDTEAWHMLGLLHWYRHTALPEGQDRSELDAAIRAFTPCFIAGIDVPDPLLPEVAEASANAAIEMLRQAVSSTDPAAASEATELWQRIVASTPADQPRREEYETYLRIALQAQSGQPVGPDEAISAIQDAVNSTPTDQPGRAAMLFNLGMLLWTRYERSGDSADLDEAISAIQDAVELHPH